MYKISTSTQNQHKGEALKLKTVVPVSLTVSTWVRHTHSETAKCLVTSHVMLFQASTLTRPTHIESVIKTEEKQEKAEEKKRERHPYLSGFHFVLVVILKDAFITQPQPPWDPLLILRWTDRTGLGVKMY